MRRLLSCRVNRADDAGGAEQTLENPNDVSCPKVHSLIEFLSQNDEDNIG